MEYDSFQLVLAPDSLKGRRILITGASSGIGAASAQLMASLGAQLLLIGRNSERLQEVSQLLNGNSHLAITCDLSVPDALYALIKSLPELWFPLSGAFHSAGIERIKPARLIKTTDLHELMASSADPAFSLARAVASKGLFSDGASIVFMSSVSALCGTPGLSAYAATKGAIEAMSRNLAVELAPRSIRVNTLVCGAIESPMHARLTQSLNQDALEDYRSRHPLGFGSANDVAQLAGFLLSDGGRWITGSSLVIDGGYSAL